MGHKHRWSLSNSQFSGLGVWCLPEQNEKEQPGYVGGGGSLFGSRLSEFNNLRDVMGAV